MWHSSLGYLFLPFFPDLLHQSSTPNPATELLTGIWDFKCWMDPFLTNVSGHSKYLVFWFTLGPHESEMHYKRFSDQPWLPAQTGLHLIFTIPHLHVFVAAMSICVSRHELRQDPSLSYLSPVLARYLSTCIVVSSRHMETVNLCMLLCEK